MAHDDDAAPGQPAGIRHGAGGGGAHDLADGADEVDAAVPGQPRLVGRVDAPCHRGVRIEVSPGQLKISAHNPEQEEAQEEVEADTRVDDLAVGFNVNYLLDALSALREEQVVLALRDANSSALVREATNDKCRHVVMPLRL